MSDAVDNFKKLFAQAPKWTIQIGGKLHVVIGDPEDATEFEQNKADLLKQARRAMLKGQTVKQNGVTEWIEAVAIYPYEWHEDGNRVRANRTHFYRSEDGSVRKEIEAQVWTKEF